MNNRHGFVSGRVQRVGFRYFVTRCARAAGVGGYVRNLADGRVEFLLQGDAAAIETVLAQIHRGPAHARVDAVELSEISGTEVFGDFSIR